MEVIKRWLDGNQNFIVGRLYYKQFGKDKSLLELFEKGQTSLTQKKLVESLTALLNEEKKEPEKPAAAVRLGVMPKGADAITEAIELEWRAMYQRMNYLRHELDKYGTDNSAPVRETCRLISLEILDIEQKCNKCWEKLDYYHEHGQVPEIKTNEFVIPTEPVELGKLIERLKRYIRRYKQKSNERPHNALYPALVKKYEEQLQLINAKK